MKTEEIIQKIKKIQIKMRRTVTEVFAGNYESAFKGRGIEPAEVREYAPGDNFRDIDWNITARYHKPYIKTYSEERERTVIFLCDLSLSGSFGNPRNKNEISAEILSVLALAATSSNDRVGLMVFTNTVEKYIPPAKGQTHILYLLRNVLQFEPSNTGTNISGALTYLNKLLPRRSVVFLLSDFIDTQFIRAFRVTSLRHELVALIIRDPDEIAIPDWGLVKLRDPETGETLWIDTTSRRIREWYSTRSARELDNLTRRMKTAGADCVLLDTGTDYFHSLSRFLQNRGKS